MEITVISTETKHPKNDNCLILDIKKFNSSSLLPRNTTILFSTIECKIIKNFDLEIK